ncbi:MAG: vitamin B12 dependent methionine synthase [Pseudomonadota bacterium]
MNEILLDNINLKLDLTSLLKKVRLTENHNRFNSFKAFLDEAYSVCRPKVLYKPLYIDKKEQEQVVMEEIVFKSRILAVNLADVHRVFAFIATCGTELDQWAKKREKMLEEFWADIIMQSVLFEAIDVMNENIAQNFNPGKTAFMTPGSLEQWPLEEQQTLFSAFSNVEKYIGVQINDEFIMTPRHSVSGIIFPTEVDYENCQLCPREECPGRRAAYDKNLYDQRYSIKASSQ